MTVHNTDPMWFHRHPDPSPFPRMEVFAMARYRKVLVAIAGALGQIATLATLPDDVRPWVQIALAILTAAGVYQAPNEPVSDERGLTDLGLVILTVVAVLLVLFIFRVNFAR